MLNSLLHFMFSIIDLRLWLVNLNFRFAPLLQKLKLCSQI